MVTGSAWGIMATDFWGLLGVDVVFKCSMVTGSAWGIMATYFWGLLGVDVVFKCSMVTGSAWGIMAAYFWGLLGVDGCIQMFGGVRTGLLLCVFPLFAYHN
jgi:hypothetical protein